MTLGLVCCLVKYIRGVGLMVIKISTSVIKPPKSYQSGERRSHM
jgi:hypothetical protein